MIAINEKGAGPTKNERKYNRVPETRLSFKQRFLPVGVKLLVDMDRKIR